MKLSVHIFKIPGSLELAYYHKNQYTSNYKYPKYFLNLDSTELKEFYNTKLYATFDAHSQGIYLIIVSLQFET